MNKQIKTKIRKLKEENRKLQKKYNEINKFNASQYGIAVDYREEERKRLVENVLKLLVRRHYGRLEHTSTKIEIDAREIEAMKQYRLEVEKNPYMQTLDIYVR